MSQGEKRYFKQFISVFEGKNKTHLKLYNAIDKQQVYDEKALKKKFEKENFAKHFAVAKNSLYNMVLKSLRFYHNNNSPQEKVNNHKGNYILLYNKGLHDLATKEIQKAKKIAEENDFFIDKILLSHWQNNETLFTEFYYNTENNTEKKLDKTLEYIDDLKEYHLYVNLCRKIELFQIQNNLRTQKAQDTLAAFVANPLLADDKIPSFFLSNYHKIMAKISCYASMKQYAKANIENEKLIDLKLKNPKIKQADPLYFHGDYNYIYISLRLFDWESLKPIIEDYLKTLSSIKTENPAAFDYDRMTFDLSFFLKLEHYLLLGKFEYIPTVLMKVEKEFEQIKDKLDDLYFLHYYYNLAYAHFMIGSYKKAQAYLVELLNVPILKNRKEYLAATHVLNLFTHYELGNFDYLSYQLKNTKQLLQRQDYLYGFEIKAITLLAKLYKVKTEQEKTIVLENYQNIFDDLAQNTWELDAFERFNIRYWLQQKLKDKLILTETE